MTFHDHAQCERYIHVANGLVDPVQSNVKF